MEGRGLAPRELGIVTCSREPRRDLVGDHLEAREGARAERGPIATSVASRPRAIRMRPMRGLLWRVERVPAVAEVHLEPGAEILGFVERHADVAEIAGQ